MWLRIDCSKREKVISMKITISEVLKKDLRIVCFLGSSWLVGLAAVYLTNNPKLLGLIPVINYIAFRIDQELKGEGYKRALEN